VTLELDVELAFRDLRFHLARGGRGATTASKKKTLGIKDSIRTKRSSRTRVLD
jgi:hypothetical protein